MKLQTIGMIGLLCLICIGGCSSQEKGNPSSSIDQDQVNQAIVTTYSDLAIQNAIIAQHTLYPYHFVNNSAELNTLGQRDLSILTAHFRSNPGKLIVQGAPDDLLYQSRGQLVYEKLLAAGIAQEKINVTDGMPGGDGMPAGSVIEILQNAKVKPEAFGSYDETRVPN